MQIIPYVSGPAQAKTFPWTCKCYCTVSSGALGVHSAWVHTPWCGVAAFIHYDSSWIAGNASGVSALARRGWEMPEWEVDLFDHASFGEREVMVRSSGSSQHWWGAGSWCAGVKVGSELVIWTSGFWGLLLSLWVQKNGVLDLLFPCCPPTQQALTKGFSAIQVSVYKKKQDPLCVLYTGQKSSIICDWHWRFLVPTN